MEPRASPKEQWDKVREAFAGENTRTNAAQRRWDVVIRAVAPEGDADAPVEIPLKDSTQDAQEASRTSYSANTVFLNLCISDDGRDAETAFVVFNAYKRKCTRDDRRHCRSRASVEGGMQCGCRGWTGD